VSLSDFTLVLVACWAGTYLLADAKILSTPRRWLLFKHHDGLDVERSETLTDLFSCYFCVGVWVSLGLFCLYGPFDRWLPLRTLAGATFAFAFNVVLERVERDVAGPDQSNRGPDQPED
jgi:hypothetical protein